MSILDFKSDTEVLFDPGYTASVARVSGNIEYIYSAFCAIPSSKQKKFQFQMLHPKLLKAVDSNVAFYLGCMLWGVYISSQKNKTIVNNPCFGQKFDDEAFLDVDFLLDFIKTTLGRDFKYYLNKTYAPNPLYIRILEIYREFLDINKGFVNINKTSSIKLPSALKSPDSKGLEAIFDTIKTAVKEDNLEILFKIVDKIL